MHDVLQNYVTMKVIVITTPLDTSVRATLGLWVTPARTQTVVVVTMMTLVNVANQTNKLLFVIVEISLM